MRNNMRMRIPPINKASPRSFYIFWTFEEATARFMKDLNNLNKSAEEKSTWGEGEGEGCGEGEEHRPNQ